MEADGMCKANHYERSPERMDSRAGHYNQLPPGYESSKGGKNEVEAIMCRKSKNTSCGRGR